MLGVGTTTLIAHAAGRGDRDEARRVFHQACLLALVLGGLVLVLGLFLMRPYCEALSADQATIDQALAYLMWFVPSLGLQFPLVAMASALRGTGVVKPGLQVQVLSVALNAILAPVLILGWGTGYPLGISGAAIATLIALVAGVAAMAWYVYAYGTVVTFNGAGWTPDFGVWRRMLNIGLPAGGEFALISFYTAVVYFIIRRFGAEAQAGVGIASRIMQSVFLPVMAVSFAASPLAGQNFGAKRGDRVREAFRTALWLGTALMLMATIICKYSPALLMRFFTTDEKVIAVGAQFLAIAAWNFVASGIVFTASGMFQALGNTWPSLACSASRIVLFVIPALWLAQRPEFELSQLWYLGVVTVLVQMSAALYLLHREFDRKLHWPAAS
jgi:putative MATE family efflux protein